MHLQYKIILPKIYIYLYRKKWYFTVISKFLTYWNQHQKVIQSKKEIWHHDEKPLCNEILLSSHSMDSCNTFKTAVFHCVEFPFIKIFICKSQMYNEDSKLNWFPVWFWKVCFFLNSAGFLPGSLQNWHWIHHSFFLEERKCSKEICEALEDLILCKLLLLWFLLGCVQWQVGAGCEENNFQNHIDKCSTPKLKRVQSLLEIYLASTSTAI